MRDRFFDLHIHVPMQTIMADRWRPEGQKDTIGVERMRTRMTAALGMVEDDVGGGWIMGGDFTLADCAAAPALFYADIAMPFGDFLSQDVRLSRPPEAAAVLRAHAEGGRAVSEAGLRGVSREAAHQLEASTASAASTKPAPPGLRVIHRG